MVEYKRDIKFNAVVTSSSALPPLSPASNSHIASYNQLCCEVFKGNDGPSVFLSCKYRSSFDFLS